MMKKLVILGCGLLCSSLMSGCTTTGKDGKKPAVRDASTTVEASALGIDGELQSTPFTDSQGRPIKSYLDKNGNTQYVDADGRRVTIGKDGSVIYGESGSVAYGEGNGLNTKVIYFDYDSSEIKPEFQSVLAAHANALVANTSARLTLKGHGDERGSREYNIGLGERRAKAVEQVLLLKGATADQLEVISFGEEQPVELGHDESAWALNRRVELANPAGF